MAYFFTFVALCSSALAAWQIWRRLHVLLLGGEADGTVVAHERRDLDDTAGFHPIISFTDHEGKPHRFTSRAGWGSPKPEVSATVRVRYLRSHPEQAYIQSFLHLWAAPLAFVVFAALAFWTASTL